MKNQVQIENELREYLMFSEYDLSDIDYDVTFNIVDVDFYYETVTVAITDRGRITQDTYQLMMDNNGEYYFEFGRFYEKKVYTGGYKNGKIERFTGVSGL